MKFNNGNRNILWICMVFLLAGLLLCKETQKSEPGQEKGGKQLTPFKIEKGTETKKETGDSLPELTLKDGDPGKKTRLPKNEESILPGASEKKIFPIDTLGAVLEDRPKDTEPEEKIDFSAICQKYLTPKMEKLGLKFEKAGEEEIKIKDQVKKLTVLVYLGEVQAKKIQISLIEGEKHNKLRVILSRIQNNKEALRKDIGELIDKKPKWYRYRTNDELELKLVDIFSDISEQAPKLGGK